MTVGVDTFNAYRLVLAKKARGLSSVGLSDITGISAASICQYENGQRKPSQASLEKLAQALNLPTSHFLREAYQSQADQIFFYRSMAATGKAARQRAAARGAWLLEIIDYLQQYVDFPIPDTPAFDDVPDDFQDITADVVENMAIKLREDWGLGISPIQNMVALTENHGVLISRQDLADKKLDALSTPGGRHHVIVLSSSNTNYFRSRFDVAHELGHLILHRKLDSEMLGKRPIHKVIEEQANYFAAAFLLPEESYAKDLWGASLAAFRTLKPIWNVSIGMQIMRCRQLEFINDQQKQRLFIALARKKWREKEPLDDSMPIEVPNLLRDAVELLINEGVKSKAQIIKDLSLPPIDIETLCALDNGYLDAEDVKPRLSIKQTSNVIPFKR